ncbi:DUF222 domain-containing protein [Nakamurella endophytica]|uniref:DUF222 domain-containing protein n=1 Tax=Nakamurella endophytica TaxID=1748367 RepID=A0A917WG28_9ACTN|nr:DUF222 domain-containing protein [Nakamurella endophytica]GGM00033.1 hypothetical protein GCM10011594_20100 [Nakamurella endophytica]
MFEPSSRTERAAVPTAADVLAWAAALPALDADVQDAERIDQLTALETLKSVCAALQAPVTAAFTGSQVAQHLSGGRSLPGALRSVAGQVALARRDSPARGRRHVAVATTLTRDLPSTLAQLRAGRISEWRAALVVRELDCLQPAERRRADAEIAPRLPQLGDRATASAAAAVAYRLDAEAVLARIRGAVADRRVTIRPAPDTMAVISALLPVTQGVAVYATLRRQAKVAAAAGDPRTRGQVMADELVGRITGTASTPDELGCRPTPSASRSTW